MNTNNTPVEYPTWQDGVIHYPPTSKTKPHQPITHQPDPNSSQSNPRPIPQLKTPPERHTRKCSICNHEDREAIEEAYLDWISPELIARQFDVAGYASVYRHVEATGLAALRRRRKLAALDLIIEQAGQVRARSSDIIRAIITSSRINDDGDYIEPVRRSEITHSVSSNKPISNRQPKLLETP